MSEIYIEKIKEFYNDTIFKNYTILKKNPVYIFSETFKLFIEYLDSNKELKNSIIHDQFIHFYDKDQNLIFNPEESNFFKSHKNINQLTKPETLIFYLSVFQKYDLKEHCFIYDYINILYSLSYFFIDKNRMNVHKLFLNIQDSGITKKSDTYMHIKNKILKFNLKALILSDFHITRGNEQIYLTDKFDLLICAGDIDGRNPKESIDFLYNISQGKPTILVLGNHDYTSMYDKKEMNMFTILNEYREQAKKYKNIYLLEKESIQITIKNFPLNIIGTTLWTDWKIYTQNDTDYKNNISNRHRSIYEAEDHREGSIDCIYIKKQNNSQWKIFDHINEYNKSLFFLEKELFNNFFFNIIVSHHAPSTLPLIEKRKGSYFFPFWETAFYCSDLEPLIKNFQPDLWIHGHIHGNFDYKIGETRVICNALGSPKKINKQYVIKF